MKRLNNSEYTCCESLSRTTYTVSLLIWSSEGCWIIIDFYIQTAHKARSDLRMVDASIEISAGKTIHKCKHCGAKSESANRQTCARKHVRNHPLNGRIDTPTLAGVDTSAGSSFLNQTLIFYRAMIIRLHVIYRWRFTTFTGLQWFPLTLKNMSQQRRARRFCSEYFACRLHCCRRQCQHFWIFWNCTWIFSASTTLKRLWICWKYQAWQHMLCAGHV